MVYIYILQLEQGRYYVGKTNNPQFRLEQHFNSTGSAWTSKYKPVSVETIIPDCDDYDEDKHTKKYMAKYGIETRSFFIPLHLQPIYFKRTYKNQFPVSEKIFKKSFYLPSSSHLTKKDILYIVSKIKEAKELQN